MGISDDDPEDCYWLVDVEKCFVMDVNSSKYTALIGALDKIDTELQGADPANCDHGRELVDEYKSIFRDLNIYETINYIIEFASRYYLNLDLNPSNFMLNSDGNVVAVDPVYGSDPTVFDV